MSQSHSERLRRALHAFANDSDGSLSVETVIVLPLLCLIYVGSFVWFDAFRMQNVNLTSTYTVADMISRETEGIDQAYFDGLEKIYGYLTYGDYPTNLRVSILECTADCDDEDLRVLEICWSKASIGREILTTAMIRQNEDIVPLFAKGDELIVAETFMYYTPAFNVGLDDQLFENVVFTQPRMPGQRKFISASGDETCYNN